MGRGIKVIENPTSVLAPAEVSAGIPFVVGTAPINLSKSATAPVNTPILVYSLKEAVDAFGYSDDWDSYTLCEVIDSHFRQFQLAPLILVNVLDPAVDKNTVAPANIAVTNGVAKIDAEGVSLSTVVVKSSDGNTTYAKDTDFTIAFDNAGKVVITRKASGTIPANATELSVGYDKLNPAAISNADIIGGVDGTTGAYSGLETIHQVFPRFGIIPGLVMAPKWSADPAVAAVMVAKAGNINAHFNAIALTDIPTGSEDLYTKAPEWKTSNGYTSTRQAVCWPKVKLGSKEYHLSTQLAGLIGITDAANDDIPFVSPSNKALKADGAVLEGGTEVYLGPDQAAYLNDQGIITALNFVGGWRSWGNNTGAYPASTDQKDAFLPIRRMFDWVANTIVLTYWQKVDDPTNRRLIETVTDSLNIWLNGLSSQGALLGGRVEFLKSENPTTDLMAGKSTFHVYLTPPGPAEEIDFIVEYDPQYLQAVFG